MPLKIGIFSPENTSKIKEPAMTENEIYFSTVTNLVVFNIHNMNVK